MYNSINTWAKVCKKLKENPKTLPVVDGLLEEDRKHIIATFKATKIAKAANMIDMENGNTGDPDYLPYFNKSPFSFRHTYCALWFSFVYGSARLCFRSRAGADFAGKTFLKVYKDMIID